MKTLYYIGAGASAEAIPIVKDSELRFRFFFFYLSKLFNTKTWNPPYRETATSRLGCYEHLIDEASRHLSYDTYAKKLFINKEWEKLHYLKEFISLYYTFEHFDLIDIKNELNNFLEIYEGRKKIKIDQGNIEKLFDFCINKRDKRYDAFIAGVLEEVQDSKVKLPPNISVISWNYDLQLEFALSEYVKEELNIHHFYDPISLSDNKYAGSNYNELIKLNGSCSYLLSGNLKTSALHELKLQPLINKSSILEDTIENQFIIFVRNSDIASEAPYINFAWEENIVTRAIKNKAKQLAEATNTIVIIGYSFPLYNREVDKYILSSFRPVMNSKIYIQALSEDDFISLKNRIKGLVEFEDSLFQFLKGASQFHVPFEINSDPSYHYQDSRAQRKG